MSFFFFFFFTDTATTEIYTLSLHDALPIFANTGPDRIHEYAPTRGIVDSKAKRKKRRRGLARKDRKSTRLNSSHVEISYAVFCLKKKKKKKTQKKLKDKLPIIKTNNKL